MIWKPSCATLKACTRQGPVHVRLGKRFGRGAGRSTNSVLSADLVNSLPVSAYEGESEGEDLDASASAAAGSADEGSGGAARSNAQRIRIRRSVSAGVSSTICHQCSICQVRHLFLVQLDCGPITIGYYVYVLRRKSSSAATR